MTVMVTTATATTATAVTIDREWLNSLDQYRLSIAVDALPDIDYVDALGFSRWRQALVRGTSHLDVVELPESRGFKVLQVSTRHVKNVSGRKSNVATNVFLESTDIVVPPEFFIG